MTFKFDRWPRKNSEPLPRPLKLCASFHSCLWIQTGVTPNTGQNRRFFGPCQIGIWQMTLKNHRAPLLFYFKPCVPFHKYQWIQTGVTVRKRPIRVKIGDFLSRVTFKNNRTTLLYRVNLCASFRSHRLIQLGVTVQKLSNLGENRQFLSRVTLKFDGWPWKTIRHLSYVTSSFVYKLIAIREFKLELLSGNRWIGLWPLWPWSLTSDIDLLHGYHFGQ